MPLSFRIFVSSVLACFVAVATARAEIKVVASILPVHSLIAGVMGDTGTPVLLLNGGASPHSYSLRPSQARLLQNADLVIWVGEDLESFLRKPLRALSSNATVITLSRTKEIRLLPAREGGTWGEPAEDHAEHADHGELDLHLWLDPTNAAAIVRLAVQELSRLNPPQAASYKRNGQHVLQRIKRLDEKIRLGLASVKERPYLVFHDAYQYFEKHFGTRGVAAMTVSPDRAPGAKRLTALRRQLKTLHAACIFAEPQFRPTVIQTIIRGTDARIAALDPLGAGLKAGPDAYFTLMQNLAQSMRKCLAATS